MKNNTEKPKSRKANREAATREASRRPSPKEERQLFDEDLADEELWDDENYDEEDDYEVDLLSRSSRSRKAQPAPAKPKKRKGSLVLPVLILVLAVTLTSLLAVVYLHHKSGMPSSSVYQTAETEAMKQYDDFTALVNNAVKPDDWDEGAFNTMKQAALDAYDQSFLTTIEAAKNGDAAARDQLNATSEITVPEQPEKVRLFEQFFTDSSAWPGAIVNLAASDPSMVDFILAYPSANKDGNRDAQIATDALQDLKTANPDWGYMQYGNGLFVQTGGAPTAISEVFSWLLQDPTFNPVTVADFARQYEYDLTPARAGDSIFAGAALNWGIPMNPLPAYQTQIGDALAAGDIVILQQGDNENPHFLVATGVDENGMWIIQDPTSSAPASAVDPASIIDSITAAFAFWL